jgi:uncharacterized protein (UPF0333 family)
MKFIKNKNGKKGQASILFTLLIMMMLFVIAMGISALILQQLKSSSEIGNSTVAFYAADAGAEKCFYQVRLHTGQGCDYAGTGYSIHENLNSQSMLDAQYASSTNQTIVSIGQTGETSRALKLTW